MELTIRPPRPGELRAALAVDQAAFGGPFGDEASVDQMLSLVEPERVLCALDEGIVATTGSFRFRLSVPGGEADAAGVTLVGVLPTHRRRGILTAFMRRQLDDLRRAGEPLAVLWASEGVIYPRFGYGVATRQAELDVDATRVALRSPSVPFRARLLSEDDAVSPFQALYEDARRTIPGMFARSETWWRASALDDSPQRRDGGPLFRCLVETDGRPAAYAAYRVREEGGPADDQRVLVVREAVAASPAGSAALWSYLLGVDLIDRVRVWHVAEDDPVFLLVDEPRRLGFRLEDALWLRLVDLPAALAARSYPADGTLVLEVADDFCAWNAGRWRLEAAGGQGRATRVDAPPDLALDVRDLASAYLGGFGVGELARAGLIQERRRGALELAHAMLGWPRAPWCPEIF
jgi:predicted acetyltransferase